jgi:hypothetical protein
MKMNMKRKLIASALIMSVGLLWSCYPGGAEYVDELDIVYTVYDVDYDFQSKGTFSLPDQIVKITGDLEEGPEFIKPVYGDEMLEQIRNNMEQLGWTYEEDPEAADINLLPAAWTSTTILVSGGYWGDYWCWYYPYYCGGGWYYPYPVVSSYTTGTLLMTIVDPNAESTDGSRRVVWTSAINGLLQGTYDVNRVNKAIDQAFAQSSYLKTN